MPEALAGASGGEPSHWGDLYGPFVCATETPFTTWTRYAPGVRLEDIVVSTMQDPPRARFVKMRLSKRHRKESTSEEWRLRAPRSIVALFAALLVPLTLTAAASADVSFTKAYGWGVADGASQFETCTSTCQAGIAGGGAGQFDEPAEVATNSSGDVYVADSLNDRIEEFSAAGAFIKAFGSVGFGAGQLYTPYGVAVDGSGDVYVADFNSSRIDEFSAAGAFIKAYGWGVLDGASQFETCTSTSTCQQGIFGSGAGQFEYPDGVATNSSRDVYVADGGNNRIEEFSSAGAFIRAFGSAGSGAGQFDEPAGVATDSSGDVYVTDDGNYRIDEFSAAGGFIKAYGWGVSDGASSFETCTSTCQAGIYGSGAGQFETPIGVATDPSGDVYVADTGYDRIDEFSAAGAFIKAIGSDGSGAGQFTSPIGVATDPSGDVYVADSYNDRIEEFSGSVAPSTLTQGPPTSATVTDGGGYSGQLTVTNPNGTVSYTETTSADSSDVVVDSSGAITASASLAPGTYTVSGSDSDTAGDSGAWAFTLTVQAPVSISGTVTNKYGLPLPGVEIEIAGAHGIDTVTDASGHYSTDEPPGTYTVTAQPANGLFAPQASSDCNAAGYSCDVTVTFGPVEADFVAQHLPVVLVTGLHDPHPGMTPGGECGSVGSMATLCTALQANMYPVYVPSASDSDTAGAFIYDKGKVRPNAASLANYLTNTVGGPALLVGHSMGGLFSRDAIGHYTAQAAGLFTIGTPFDGSYGADVAEADSQAQCPSGVSGLKCKGLKKAAEDIENSLGAEAVADLTAASRQADNISLPQTGVPTWTVAGTACTATSVQQANDTYEYPNDGIVGLSSAWGVTANLGGHTQLRVEAYHSATVNSILGGYLHGGHCVRGAPNELDASEVATKVVGAASTLDSVSEQPDLRGHTASDELTAARKSASFTVNLQTLTVRSIRPGAAIPLGPSGFVSTETAFRLTCPHTAPGDSQPVLGSRKLFAVPGAAFKCRDPSLTATKPVTAMIASDPDRVRARFTRTRRGYKISITALKPLRGVVLERHGTRVRVKMHWRTRRSVSMSLTTAQASQITLTATANRVRYSASL